ncbi:MAG: helix-turn-helix domain-containing protein [Bacteroidota bacterium]|jgi:transcriptional regulator with XRE-family HTH domain
MEFGDRLKEIRTGLNYSQTDLAEKTGLTLRTIQRIENNEVKPSLHSIKVISEALEIASSEFINKSDAKPYEFNFTIKITDMNQFLSDLKILVKNHWKVIVLIIAVVWLLSNYADIKSGILDGWSGK